MKFERIDCPVCDGSDNTLILKAKDYRFGLTGDIFNIVKCNVCDFTFLNPRPHEAVIQKYYPQGFNRQDRSFSYLILKPFFTLAQRNTLRLLKKYKQGGKILDIGCGNGEFIQYLYLNGYGVYGIEQNSGAKEYACRLIKDKILYKDIQQCNFEPESFDIVTMLQSLEHIYDLNNLFKEVHRILKRDGILYICAPDINFYEYFLFGKYAYNLEVPRHLYFFNRKTVSKMLLKYGFIVKTITGDSLWDFVSTPASFYHSMMYFMNEKEIKLNSLLRKLFFLLLVTLRCVFRSLIRFQSQNFKIISTRK